nr:hypothetical protein CFP56_16885 [Quercus suber]
MIQWHGQLPRTSNLYPPEADEHGIMSLAKLVGHDTIPRVEESRREPESAGAQDLQDTQRTANKAGSPYLPLSKVARSQAASPEIESRLTLHITPGKGHGRTAVFRS